MDDMENKIDEPKGYWRIIHSRGCKGIVFYTKEKPEVHARISADIVIKLDGSIPESCDFVFCGTCLKRMDLSECYAEDSTLIN